MFSSNDSAGVWICTWELWECVLVSSMQQTLDTCQEASVQKAYSNWVLFSLMYNVQMRWKWNRQVTPPTRLPHARMQRPHLHHMPARCAQPGTTESRRKSTKCCCQRWMCFKWLIWRRTRTQIADIMYILFCFGDLRSFFVPLICVLFFCHCVRFDGHRTLHICVRVMLCVCLKKLSSRQPWKWPRQIRWSHPAAQWFKSAHLLLDGHEHLLTVTTCACVHMCVCACALQEFCQKSKWTNHDAADQEGACVLRFISNFGVLLCGFGLIAMQHTELCWNEHQIHFVIVHAYLWYVYSCSHRFSNEKLALVEIWSVQSIIVLLL